MSRHIEGGYDSATESYHATFDPESEPASDVVVSSISDVSSTEPDDFASVEDVVDPIVFDAFVRRCRRPMQIGFVYHDHSVTVDTGGEIWIQRPPDGNRTESEFAFGTDESPSHAVIRGLAEVNGVTPTEMLPLYEFINPDALDAVCDDTTEGGANGVLVSFRMDEWEITVTSDRRVEIRDASAVE